MGKISIQEISRILVEKRGLSYRDSERFVMAIFDVVQVGLERDKLVKIKGLGTFKVIEVSARESVNVNTGERVVIESHGRLTFTPDATMKELVNKPFSQFETVVLNDGVEFDDMQGEQAEQVAETDADKETDVTVDESGWQPADEMPRADVAEYTGDENTHSCEEPVLENVGLDCAQADEETSVPLCYGQIPEDIESLDKDASAAGAEETGGEPDTNDDDPEKTEVPECSDCPDKPEQRAEYCEPDVIAGEPVDCCGEKKTGSRLRWTVFCVISFSLIVLAAYTGYLYGLHIAGETSVSKTPAPLPAIKDTVTLPVETVVRVPDSLKEKKADSAKHEKVKADTLRDVVSPVTKTTQDTGKKAEIFDSDKYDKMDSRVRTGAYRIIGTDHVVTVKSGDNLGRISDRALGKGMVCYVEVYNGLKEDMELKEGQKIKIPKLRLKRKKSGSLPR